MQIISVNKLWREIDAVSKLYGTRQELSMLTFRAKTSRCDLCENLHSTYFNGKILALSNYICLYNSHKYVVVIFLVNLSFLTYRLICRL